MTTPYYDRAGVVLHLADCRDILPTIDPSSVGLLLTDPPYGVNYRTTGFTSGRSSAGRVGGGIRAYANDYPPIHGDDVSFDPTHLLAFPRVVLFGANHYAHLLPDSPAWLVWDKLDGLRSKRAVGFNDQADVELAWSNLGGPARLYPVRWMGLMKGTERDERRVHPTQKPVALMARIIEAHTQPGDLVLDPYAGSGSTLVAAKAAGHPAIGCEISERYCEVIARRLDQDVLPLFGAVS